MIYTLTLEKIVLLPLHWESPIAPEHDIRPQVIILGEHVVSDKESSRGDLYPGAIPATPLSRGVLSHAEVIS